MTPLPAFSEQVVERRDLPEYEIPGRCCNPRCPNRADDPHEIRPRSQTAGVVWWIELPGRFLIGNRVGICRGCHGRTDDHTAAIIWDDEKQELAWCELTPDPGWAEGLNPSPPVHKTKAGIDVFVATNVAEQHRLNQDLDEPYVAPIDQPIESEAVEGHGGELEPLGRSMQNMERFLEAAQYENDRAVHGFTVERDGERVDPASISDGAVLGPMVVDEAQSVEPNVLEPEPEDQGAGDRQGSDPATVAVARAAAEGAQQHAADVTGLGEFQPTAAPWQADVIVYPEESRVEVLHGDLRVGSFIEEQIEKAKRAPKPREPKPAEDPDRPKEPAKARRTWSVSVPADERDGEKVAAGEDGATLIEEALELLRQRFGRDDHPSWRYFVLVEGLQWMLLNYTDEGED